MKKSIELFLLTLLHGNLLTGALYGGVSMIIAPDGHLLGMNTEWLNNSPFTSFLIPGIILSIIGVLFPALCLFGLWTKKEIRLIAALNIFRDKHWAWAYSLYTGIMMVIWIAIQQLMTQYFILQPLISLNGIGIVIITLLPSVQKAYAKSELIAE